MIQTNQDITGILANFTVGGQSIEFMNAFGCLQESGYIYLMPSTSSRSWLIPSIPSVLSLLCLRFTRSEEARE